MDGLSQSKAGSCRREREITRWLNGLTEFDRLEVEHSVNVLLASMMHLQPSERLRNQRIIREASEFRVATDPYLKREVQRVAKQVEREGAGFDVERERRENRLLHRLCLALQEMDTQGQETQRHLGQHIRRVHHVRRT